VRACERVEERAFAGVGIADKRDGGHGNRFASLALLTTDAADRFEVELELVNAALNAPAIGFELGFAGSTGADTAAELGHGFAAACESGQHVFELSELNLKLAFAGSSVAGEDVEDELRAVEDAARQSRLEVAQLCGREVVIEENKIGVGGGGDAGDLFHLAGTDKGGGIGLGPALQDFRGDGAAGTDQQLAKFSKRLFGG
jgi:hypothetical protein